MRQPFLQFVLTALLLVPCLGCQESVSDSKPALPEPAVEAADKEEDGAEQDESDDDASAAETEASPDATARGADGAAEPAPQPLTPEQIVDARGDGIVRITARNALGRDVNQGTGFVVSPDGLVATNLHVVVNAVSAIATFRDGREREVLGTVATRAERDLALLRIEPLEDIDVFQIAPDIEPTQGQQVLAIGHPAGFEFTVSTGIVSAVRTTPDLPEVYRQSLDVSSDTRWIQTSAAISVGSSGGPLLDQFGRVIGLTTWIAAGENLGFAVNADHLRETLAQVKDAPVASFPVPGSGLLVDPDATAVVMAATRDHREWVNRVSTLEQNDEVAARRVAAEENPVHGHVERLWKLADEASNETAAVDALAGILTTAVDDSHPSRKAFRRALDRLRERHLDSRRLTAAAVALASAPRREAVLFLDELVRRSPHPVVQRTACEALCRAGFGLAPQYDRYAPLLRRGMRQLANDYAGVRAAGVRGDAVDHEGRVLFQLESLAAGCIAPDIAGPAADDTPLSLREHRGQVVVLDFWSDQSPACRRMYDTKRGLVERYADQPFALLGVNLDDAHSLQQLVAAGTVNWPNWIDGQDGPLAEKWAIDIVPRTFVIEPSGRIGYASPRAATPAAQLHSLVEWLLFRAADRLPFDVVPLGDTWRYHASTRPPQEGWRRPDFADDDWPAARAPFGFGWGDEATALPAEPVTCCFRRRFQLDDLDAVRDFGIRVHFDDAVALYVNGVEVGRSGIVDQAGHDEFAARPSFSHGFDPAYYAVPKSALRAGENVLAVEVHQARLGRDSARFDLAAGTNWVPALREALAGDDPPHLAGTLFVVAALGPAAAELQPDVQRFLDREDLTHAFAVRHALARIAPQALDDVPPGVPGADELQFEHVQLATSMAASAWKIARSPRFSSYDYRSALSYLDAARKLVPAIASGPGPRRTRAWALARAGDHQAALAAIRGKSLLKFQYEPWELACQVYCHRALGKQELADKALEQLEKRLQSNEYVFDTDSQDLYDEVRPKPDADSEPD